MKTGRNPPPLNHSNIDEGGTLPNFSTSRVTLIDMEEFDNITQRSPSPEVADATSEEEVHVHVLYGMLL